MGSYWNNPISPRLALMKDSGLWSNTAIRVMLSLDPRRPGKKYFQHDVWLVASLGRHITYGIGLTNRVYGPIA